MINSESEMNRNMLKRYYSPLIVTLVFLFCNASAFADNSQSTKKSDSVLPDGEAQSGGSVTAKADTSKSAPWANSSVLYRNAVTALSFNEGYDPTYNPVYEMSLTFLPRWQFSKIFSISGQFALSRELTHSDWTTESGEVIVSDLTIRPGASAFYTVPVIDVAISADLPLTFPTSKYSRMKTLNMAIGPGLRLSKRFDLLSGITLSYGIRGTFYWHEYTTGESEESKLPGVPNNNGVRNPLWRISNSFSLSVALLKELSISIGYTHINTDLGDSYVDDRVTMSPQTPTDMRYTDSYGISINFSPVDFISFELGLDTTNQQLQADGQGYYTGFFNRFSILYFDIAVNLGWLG